MDECKKAVELGFADALMEDPKRAVNVDAYSFSTTGIENAIINKIAAKTAEKPEGRSVDVLMERLNLLKY